MGYCCIVYVRALTDLLVLTLQVELPVVAGLLHSVHTGNESTHPSTKLSFFWMFTVWKALK